MAKTLFRLKSITLKDSEDFEAGSYVFIQDDLIKDYKFPFTTLIIGPNGTGKSRLLRAIIDIFNDLHNYKTQSRKNFKFNHYYNLKYYLNGDFYEVENNREDIVIKKNTETLADFDDIILPTKGIAAAYSLHEKFSPKESSFVSNLRRKSRYDNDFYEYLGIKTTRNYTFSSANINNSIDLITGALAESGFEKDLKAVFNVLGFLPKITVSYEVRRNRELFSGNLTVQNVSQILENIEYKAAGFSYSSIQNLKQASGNEIERVVYSLNEASRFLGHKLKLPVDLLFDESYGTQFSNLYPSLSILRRLNLIHYDKIFVYKKVKNNPEGQQIDLRAMSSGEIQILTSLLALASIVKENCLVLIDEPEISLHPNWQMQYIDLLNKIFKSFSSVHFLIATHSHLLASDILTNSSAILALTRNSKLELISELLDSTYGNSAENILYNVFGVASARNQYFESDINRLLLLLSRKSKNKKEFVTLLSKIKKFKALPSDPLSLVIKDAEKYLAKTWH